MDIETMQTVYMLAITGSFTTTAAMIHCSQPTVSRRIKQAEEELGIAIFHRHSSHDSITLTNEGRHIVNVFSQITKQYDDLVREYKEDNKGKILESINLGIAGNTMITSAGIDYLYSDFVQMHPNSKISIIRETEENTLRLLTTGKIDYAVFTRYVWNNAAPFIHYELNENLRVSSFAKNNISIATSEHSDFANKKSFTMQELKDIPFVYSGNIHNMPTNNVPTIHIIFFEACRMSGFTTKLLVLDHPSRALRNQTVFSGKGCTHGAIPEKLGAYAGIKYIPISDAPIHGEFFLVSSTKANIKEFNAIQDWLKTYFE